MTSSSLFDSSHQIAYATDGNFMTKFGTLEEANPWIQWEFANEVKVIRVILTHRIDCTTCDDNFVQVGFHLGNNPIVAGTLTSNPLCNFIEGPVSSKQQQVIECTNDVTGKYFIIQKQGTDTNTLGFNEIVIHGTVL